MQTFTNIDEYIANFSAEIANKLTKIRAVIKKAAPKATEKISYGMPTFVHNGLLVHFSVNKNHIGFYPSPSGIAAFSKELTNWKHSKGAIQFPLNKEIPFDLIAEISAYRYNENMNKIGKGKVKNNIEFSETI